MCFSDECDKSRRKFLKDTAATTLVTFAVLETGAFAQQQTKQPDTRVLDDPRVEHGKVMFKHNGANSIDGYLARPKAEGKYPAVVVIAGNRITEEYIPNTCAGTCRIRRTCAECFSRFARLGTDNPRNAKGIS